MLALAKEYPRLQTELFWGAPYGFTPPCFRLVRPEHPGELRSAPDVMQHNRSHNPTPDHWIAEAARRASKVKQMNVDLWVARRI